MVGKIVGLVSCLMCDACNQPVFIIVHKQAFIGKGIPDFHGISCTA